MQTQAIVIGAGPVGLTMAMELARYGIAVRIIDKAAQRTDKSKALVLWPRTLELLARAGCAGVFVAAGHKVLAANVIAAGEPIAHVQIDSVHSPFAYALMLPQADTERLLEDQLAKLGIKVERQVELTGVVQDAAGVTATLRQADGREESVRSGWLCACDGAHSTVRHALGIGFAGDTLKSDWLLADIHLHGSEFPDSEIATFWHADGVLVIFPIAPSRYRVIADLGEAHGQRPADPTLVDVQAIMAQRGPAGLVASDPIWLAAFRINERKVADYRAARVFLAGDAAHVHSPAGGQGMNTGMQDAFNLAWKLALVSAGTAAPVLLDSYSSERSAVGEEVLKQAGRVTRLAVMRNHTAQVVRNAIGRLLFGLAPVQRAVVGGMTEVSVGYAHSLLNGAHAHGLDGPAPGARMPPADAADASAASAAGSRARYRLYAAQTVDVAPLLEEFADLLGAEPLPPPDARGIWLVRPDGYVAAVVARDDPQALAAYLRAWRAAGGTG